MTLWLSHWLQALASSLSSSAQSRHPYIDAIPLSARDIADLNLPPDIAGRLAARQAAEELRRRTAW